MDIYDLAPAEAAKWKAATKPIVDDWVKSMEEKGLPGNEILEFARNIVNQGS